MRVVLFGYALVFNISVLKLINLNLFFLSLPIISISHILLKIRQSRMREDIDIRLTICFGKDSLNAYFALPVRPRR